MSDPFSGRRPSLADELLDLLTQALAERQALLGGARTAEVEA